MGYDLNSLERPQHLVAYVMGRDEPLVDARIRQADRKTPIWNYSSDELWTPLSLPLRISVTLGAKNSLQIWTADTRLLEVGLVDCSIIVSLLLPTDERLDVRVEERSYAERRAN
jgi:hypothetical protein